MSPLVFYLFGLAALTQVRSSPYGYGYQFVYHLAVAPCDTVLCRGGLLCQEDDEGKPQCVEVSHVEAPAVAYDMSPCATVDCADGSRCVVDEMFHARCIETNKFGQCPATAAEVGVYYANLCVVRGLPDIFKTSQKVENRKVP